MAKGQHLSAHQKGIVKRYYEHRDTIALQKLGEIVSDLYLCTDRKKADRLWEGAAKVLGNAGASPAQVRSATGSRDIQALARLVNELSGK